MRSPPERGHAVIADSMTARFQRDDLQYGAPDGRGAGRLSDALFIGVPLLNRCRRLCGLRCPVFEDRASILPQMLF